MDDTPLGHHTWEGAAVGDPRDREGVLSFVVITVTTIKALLHPSRSTRTTPLLLSLLSECYYSHSEQGRNDRDGEGAQEQVVSLNDRGSR